LSPSSLCDRFPRGEGPGYPWLAKKPNKNSGISGNSKSASQPVKGNCGGEVGAGLASSCGLTTAGEHFSIML
jgi:hypothetical protein